ncbi:MAG: C-terminal target protein [Bacteroidetes bacterium]|nr:C-terminal target protein [Bacteroidota bacterium]
MKKIYLFLLMSSAFGASAQYTLTSASNPVIGDIEKTWALDTANLSLGSPGTAQIWNYTNITISPSTSVTANSYVSPTAAPNAASFPAGVNIATTTDGASYNMFGYTSSDITFYGIDDPNFIAVFQNPEKYITFPFSYGMISTDTYSASFTYSAIPITINGTVTVTADGWGTLNTPGNSYANTLRLKIQDKSIQTTGAFGTTTNTSVGYSYFNGASKFELLSVQTQTSTSSTSTVVTKTKSGKVNNIVLAGIKKYDNTTGFSLYPNPAVNKEVSLHFNLTSTETYSVTVFNVLGQQVLTQNLGEKAPGSYNETVKLNDLSGGVYYIHLKGKKQEGVQKLIIE